MKFAIFAALMLTVTAAVPRFHGSMIENNNFDRALIDGSVQVMDSKPVALPLAKSYILNSIAKELDMETFDLISAELEEVVSKAQEGIEMNTYHVLSINPINSEEAQACEISIIRNEKSVQVVVAQARVPTMDSVSGHHVETYTSAFMLPFEEMSSRHLAEKEYVKNIKSVLLSSAISKVEFEEQPLRGLNEITGGINAIADTWRNIATAFRSEKSTTLVAQLPTEGFAKYRKNSSFIKTENVPIKFFDLYIKSWVKFTEMTSSKYYPEIQGFLELAQFVDTQAWNINDFNFDKDKDGTLDTIVCITGADMMLGKFSVASVKVNGSFQLSPNKFLWAQSKSTLGGITSSNKHELKTERRDITEKDVNSIHNLMILGTLETMAKGFGINFKLPTDDINRI